MLIDWFTVGAQALNFLVLVWLMKRFLYQPVLNAIDAREKRITDQITDAKAQQKEAEAARITFEDKNNALDKERDDLLRKATSNAQDEANLIIKKAHQAADALSTQRKTALAHALEKTQHVIAEKVGQEVFALSKNALKHLATQDLEDQIIQVFVSHLRTLPGPAQSKMDEAFKTASSTAIVRSAFVLTPSQSALVQTTCNEVFETTAVLCFEVKTETICGIALSVGGQKIEWNISHHLAELQDTAQQLLLRHQQGESIAPEGDIPVAPHETPVKTLALSQP